MKIDAGTQAEYLRELEPLTEKQLERAARSVRREWDKPHMMPPIAFILAHAGNDGRVTDSDKILERGAKPPGWELVPAEEYEEWLAAGRLRQEDLRKAVLEAVLKGNAVPAVRPLTEQEWNARRDRQLAEWRARKNK